MQTGGTIDRGSWAFDSEPCTILASQPSDEQLKLFTNINNINHIHMVPVPQSRINILTHYHTYTHINLFVNILGIFKYIF
jgi:hypothetical protein